MNTVPFKSKSRSRTNGEKKNSVQGQIWTGNLASGVEAAIKDEIEAFKLSLPAGYSLESDGEADTAAESQGQIISSAAIFFVLIVIGLVAALNSFKQAGIILSVAILCIGLSFVVLVIGQQNYGFIATVGAIGLAGLLNYNLLKTKISRNHGFFLNFAIY